MTQAEIVRKLDDLDIDLFKLVRALGDDEELAKAWYIVASKASQEAKKLENETLLKKCQS